MVILHFLAFIVIEIKLPEIIRFNRRVVTADDWPLCRQKCSSAAYANNHVLHQPLRTGGSHGVVTVVALTSGRTSAFSASGMRHSGTRSEKSIVPANMSAFVICGIKGQSRVAHLAEQHGELYHRRVAVGLYV
jgi:hypothetical protein